MKDSSSQSIDGQSIGKFVEHALRRSVKGQDNRRERDSKSKRGETSGGEGTGVHKTPLAAGFVWNERAPTNRRLWKWTEYKRAERKPAAVHAFLARGCYCFPYASGA